MSNEKIQFINLPVTETDDSGDLPMPELLVDSRRSGAAEIDPLLKDLSVEKVFRLGVATRGEKISKEKVDVHQAELLAIEAEDGTTLFVRSDKLVEDIARIRPEAIVDGQIDFDQFRDPNADSRGLGDIFWKAVSVLKLPDNGLINEASELAQNWAKETGLGKVKDKVYDAGSFLGAKALMYLIESRLAGNSGLYAWTGENIRANNRCGEYDKCLEKAARGKPMLLLIHGTASYTQAAFDDLRKDVETWKALREQFPGGIFGYEHKTFSQSPIENALELVQALPKNARLSLLTHSRGGLVGDLISLGRNINPAVIDAYRIDKAKCEDVEGLEQEELEERQRLRTLLKTLKQKDIVVQRYVRVASPARGTRLLSENLDVALSDFTNLLQTAGSALTGVVAGAIGGPAAAKNFGKGASSALGVLKRLVLEIAGRRIDPKLVPGIAAMCVDSPLASFLVRPDTTRHDATEMAIIAGDTEFDSLGMSNFRRRIINLFCDWRLFDQHDNDLVVDTDSMYAGLGFQAGTRYLFDQAPSVTHFRYFANLGTRKALRDWMIEEDLSKVKQFLAITSAAKIPWKERDARTRQRGGEVGPRPVVILVPGIMGTHIEINRKKDQSVGSGNRIWFDFASLAIGDLERIADPSSKKVFPEELLERSYGDLYEHLQQSHMVIRFAYDWRKTLKQGAEDLSKIINQAVKDNPDQPIRLLAHSMGGLVVRALMQHHPDEWNSVVNSGGRLVMLGTPNNGSHKMVHTLLGKADSIRMLARIDLKHNLQQIVDIVKNFPGALSLLPHPDFKDIGNQTAINPENYFRSDVWQQLKNKNRDFWFGNQIGAVPDNGTLDSIKTTWEGLSKHEIANPERVSYVYGQGEKTACGVIEQNGRLQLQFTRDGDGTVTWKSGQLDGLEGDQYWYMPVEHGDLASVSDYFPAITELLEKGATGKLDRLPRSRGGEKAETFILDAPPPVYPGENELMHAMTGGRLQQYPSATPLKTLKVSMRVGDLNYCTSPVICGHYYGDVISGAEKVLDTIVGEQLQKRQRLGIYADAIGTSTIAMLPPNPEETRRKTRRGVIVVGLGEMNGRLSSTQLTETVRAGILRFLLRTQEIPDACQPGNIKLTSLLIGQNSTTQISIAESLVAITRGICEANAKFSNDDIFVTEIEFIELYRDIAITAAHAIRYLPERLGGELERMGIQLAVSPQLKTGEGARNRLWATSRGNYWPRLIVTDAEKTEVYCPPECAPKAKDTPVTIETLRELLDDYHKDDFNGDRLATGSASKKNKPGRKFPERLRYVFVSARARSESIALQRQPGLIEAIVKQQINQNRYNRQLSRTLFELMVPLDYKPTAREVDRLVLQVDSFTANLPWELLQAENSKPMVMKTAMVRQLSTQRYRRNVRTAPDKTACVIANPSTVNFGEYFGRPDIKRLPSLSGAVKEGDIIWEKLREAGYSQENISFSRSGSKALAVLHNLLSRPYRILSISAHGIYEAPHIDGKPRTGVVLSEGSLITAAEIGQMEVVPELVFLNCCHLGVMTSVAYNRLAYSISRELIEMGVRCIVAAGWAVDDAAACTFAEVFFDQMLIEKECFGNAVHEARKQTYNKHRSTNTWGAYQAYGDPGYRLDPASKTGTGPSSKLCALDELLYQLRKLRLRGNQPNKPSADIQSVNKSVSRLRERTPPEWFELPEVLEALGKIYADLGSDGFAAARNYYLHAIALKDDKGIVAIKTIEQLANLEARTGEKRSDRKLIDAAIKRLKALLDLSSLNEQNPLPNPERAALLGSAYRKLASYGVTKKGKKWAWESLENTLIDAANAYKMGTENNPAAYPYNTLNYLQCKLLADPKAKTKNNISLAQSCGETARQKYNESGKFWDAVMSADASMTAWLLGDKLPLVKIDGKNQKNDFESLKQIYQDSISGVPASSRHMDSVTTNLCQLSQFLNMRNLKDDIERAEILAKLANELGTGTHCKMPSISTNENK